MLYLITDPCPGYSSFMMKFLYEHARKAIAVFTSEGSCQAFHDMCEGELGECLADEYLLSEFADTKALADQILSDWPDEPIEGVIPWSEFQVELGAELAEHLGLDWNPREVINRFRNKYNLKEYLRNNSEVKINASRVVNEEEEALEFQEQLDKWPIVVKPSQGAGSRKVFFTQDRDELVERCREVFSSGMGEVLLEEFVTGNEFVVNGITDAEHDVLITDVWFYDKRESHGYKNLYYETVKVNTNDPVFEPLTDYAGAVISALGLRKSPFHMELKLEESGPCLIEVGCRFAGGNQPLLASRLHDRSLFELAACHYLANLPLHLGEVHYDRYDSHQARIISGIQTYEIPTISGLEGVAAVEALPSFFMFGLIMPTGSHLPVTQDLFGKSYEVYLFHEDPEQIADDAQKVRELLRYY